MAEPSVWIRCLDFLPFNSFRCISGGEEGGCKLYPFLLCDVSDRNSHMGTMYMNKAQVRNCSDLCLIRLGRTGMTW